MTDTVGLARIVNDLANSPAPIGWNDPRDNEDPDEGRCLLCGYMVHGSKPAAQPENPEAHKSSCPWRRAKEHQATIGRHRERPVRSSPP